MVNRIQYNQTQVLWYPIDGIDLNYQSRVIADGGTVEAMECVYDGLAALTGYYDYECAGDTPLKYRWHGDRYDAIRGSEITWTVIVKTKADQDELDKMLSGGYYVRVEKEGKIVWIGKVFPQFFTEPYKQYPYTVELSGSDQLGQLKQYHFLMIDFPEPFIADAPTVKLMDVINRALTDPSFKPASSQPTAPNTLNISCLLWHGTEGEAFVNTYIDPLVFMDDKDQYTTKHEMLTAILEPLYLKLFLWDGAWWLMSIDAMWDNAKYRYYSYHLDYSGWTSIGKLTDVDDGVLNLYPDNTGEAYPDNRQVFNDAQINYLPSWLGVNLISEFQQNTCTMPTYANKSGGNYDGDGSIFLELLPIPYISILKNWEDQGLRVSSFSENSGYMNLTMFNSDQDGRAAKTEFTLNSLVDETSRKLSLTFSITDNTNYVTRHQTINYFYFVFSVKYTKNNISRWLVYDEDDGIIWRDTSAIVFIKIKRSGPVYNESITIPRPLDEENGHPSTIEVKIRQPIISKTGDYQVGEQGTILLKNFTMAPTETEWEAINYKTETAGIFDTVTINPKGTLPPPDKTFTWGLAHSSLSNDHAFHYSTPYELNGIPLNRWLKSGTPSGGYGLEINRILDWLLISLHDDNLTYTRKLTASYKSKDITPLRVIRDYDGYIYQFVNGEFDDKRGIWTVEYIQAKWIRNVPGILNKCDYSPVEFNNDFCFEYLPMVRDYRLRVEADGGTVEAIECVNEALIKLTL